MGKKLLILANHFATIYKFRKELVSKLVEEGYEVVISLPFSQDIEKIKGLGVKVIDTNVDRKSVNPIIVKCSRLRPRELGSPERRAEAERDQKRTRPRQTFLFKASEVY